MAKSRHPQVIRSWKTRQTQKAKRVRSANEQDAPDKGMVLGLYLNWNARNSETFDESARLLE